MTYSLEHESNYYMSPKTESGSITHGNESGIIIYVGHDAKVLKKEEEKVITEWTPGKKKIRTQKKRKRKKKNTQKNTRNKKKKRKKKEEKKRKYENEKNEEENEK